MNTIHIDMFSKEETKIFGLAMFGLVFSCFFLYMLVEAAALLADARVRKRELDRKDKVSRTYEVDLNEFEMFGKQALAEQTMKSFIAETEIGRQIEFTVDEILDEVKARK